MVHFTVILVGVAVGCAMICFRWATNKLFEKSKMKLKNRRCFGIMLFGKLR